MLTLYTGNDGATLRNDIEKRTLLARKAGSEIVRITDTTFSRELLSSYFGGDDLFGKHFFVVLDRIFANPEAKEFLFSSVKEFKKTANDFVLFEEKLAADELKELEREGVVVETKKKTAVKAQEEFNIFALADALGNRDKKSLWTLYMAALRSGKTPEEISGTLFWQLKSMLLVAKGGGASLSPFVKTKAERFTKKYSIEELEALALTFVSEYHESRRGGLPLEGRLEKIILSL